MKSLILICVAGISAMCTVNNDDQVIDHQDEKLVKSEEVTNNTEVTQEASIISLIEWNKHDSLTWADFQGIPDTSSTYKAMTFVQTDLKSEQHLDSIEVHVTTLFYKNLSWSKRKQSNTLLKHEQVHFDIAELMSRKIRKAFYQYISIDIDKTYTELMDISRKFHRDKLDQYNFKYDEETDHGTILAKQEEWEAKIANELKALGAYSSTRVVIKRINR
jgi:hypothetical protein